MQHILPPIIEVRSKRWQSLLPIPFILFLLFVFYWFLFGPGVESLDAPPPLAFKIFAVFFMGVGLFLLQYMVRISLKPATILRVDEEGLEMNTGVSTGLIRWEMIERITQKLILTSGGGGSSQTGVIAVYLKDPERYRNQYNVLLKNAVALNEKLNGASILIPYGYLSKDYPLFEEVVKRKLGREIEVE